MRWAGTSPRRSTVDASSSSSATCPLRDSSAHCAQSPHASTISAASAALCRWLTVSLTACVSLAGCAQTLPALSSGLDGARQVIAVSCPARTTPCEGALNAYNVAVNAYNTALLADAVGQDAGPLAEQGMAALKQLWAALMQVRP